MTSKLDEGEGKVLAHLRRLIRLQGPINIADYMRIALYHPEAGYYVKGSALGRKGDFITAPEISQTFGEMIGLWCVQSWVDMGAPPAFNLVELGPGRGTLMSDLLRAAKIRPDFITAAQIALVETQEDHRRQQKEALNGFASVSWHDDLSTLGPGPSLFIANEFFDCLPIRQYVRVEDGWCERLVGLDETDALTFMLAAPPVPRPPEIPQDLHNAKLGQVFETGVTTLAIAENIGHTLAQCGGRALIIDYGYDSPTHGDTLQALYQHKRHNVLDNPGRADLTAHVNFADFATAAKRAGAVATGPVSQGSFLSDLGIETRMEQLCANVAPDHALSIRNDIKRLTEPTEMGTLFQVMVMSSPGLPPPAGFSSSP